MKQKSRILASLTAFFLVLAGSTLALAAPASAHHGTITSTVACVSGKTVVTWNIKNSENHSAQVTGSTGTGNLPNGTVVPASGTAGHTWNQTIESGSTVDISVSLVWPKNKETNTATARASSVGEDCDTPVTPVKPTLVNPVCGDSAHVVLPKTTGVSYQKTVLDNGNVKVTASPASGYKFPANVTSEWTFKIPPVVPCDVTVMPVAPTLGTPECGYEAVVQLTAVTGVTYAQNRVGDVVTVTAMPNTGYSFATGTVTSWQLTIPATVICDEPVEPVAPMLSTPECGEVAMAPRFVTVPWLP